MEATNSIILRSFPYEGKDLIGHGIDFLESVLSDVPRPYSLETSNCLKDEVERYCLWITDGVR